MRMKHLLLEMKLSSTGASIEPRAAGLPCFLIRSVEGVRRV